MADEQFDFEASREDLARFLETAPVDESGNKVLSRSAFKDFLTQGSAPEATPIPEATPAPTEDSIASKALNFFIDSMTMTPPGGSRRINDEDVSQIGKMVGAPVEIAAGVGGGALGAALGSPTGPGALVTASAAGAGAAGVAREIMQELGLQPRQELSEDLKDVGTEFAMGVVAGPVLKAVGSGSKLVGKQLRKLSDAIDQDLNIKANLARAFTEDPKQFNTLLSERGVGGQGETIEQGLEKMRNFLSTFKPDKRSQVFRSIEKGVSEGIEETGKAIDSTLMKTKEVLGDPKVSYGDLGLDDIIDELDGVLAEGIRSEGDELAKLAGGSIDDATRSTLNGFKLSEPKRKALLKVASDERNRIAREALGKDVFNDYQNALKKARSLENLSFKRSLSGGALKDTEQEALENARTLINSADEVIRDTPFDLDQIVKLRRQFDGLAKLDTRGLANLENRVRAEANFAIGNHLRGKIKDIVSDAGLSDALENLNTQFGRLKRIEPLVADRAALERMGKSLVKPEVQGSILDRIVQPRRSPIDNLEIGLQERGTGAGIRSAVSSVNRALSSPIEELGDTTLDNLPQAAAGVAQVVPDALKTVLSDALGFNISDVPSLNVETGEIQDPADVGVIQSRIAEARKDGSMDSVEASKQMSSLNRTVPKLAIPDNIETPPAPIEQIEEEELEQEVEEDLDVSTVAGTMRRSSSFSDINSIN